MPAPTTQGVGYNPTPAEPQGGMIDLAHVANKNRFVRPRIATSQGSVSVAAGVTQSFVSFFDQESEGVVIGFSFWTSGGNYVQTPVGIGQCGASQVQQGQVTGRLDIWDSLNVALSPRSVPFIFPDSFGYFFQRGRAVALQISNTTGAPISVEGFLLLLTWSEANRKQALSMISDWKKRVGPAFGGEEIFS